MRAGPGAPAISHHLFLRNDLGSLMKRAKSLRLTLDPFLFFRGAEAPEACSWVYAGKEPRRSTSALRGHDPLHINESGRRRRMRMTPRRPRRRQRASGQRRCHAAAEAVVRSRPSTRLVITYRTADSRRHAPSDGPQAAQPQARTPSRSPTRLARWDRETASPAQPDPSLLPQAVPECFVFPVFWGTGDPNH
jgi:hypothetical protein